MSPNLFCGAGLVLAGELTSLRSPQVDLWGSKIQGWFSNAREDKKVGRIVFWAQLNPKIDQRSI